MKLRRITIAALLVTVGFLVVAQTGCAPAEEQLERLQGDDRRISVSGSGTVSAEPDEAVLRLGVETMAETAQEAMAQNSQQMQAVIDGLKEAGVPTESIQTQTVQLRPQYESPDREPGHGAERELVGYVASNIVEATTEDLGAVGELLDVATQAGANRIEGIDFRVTNATDLLGQAREAAWENAEEKAAQLAELSGVTLGEVLTINESTRGPRPVYAARELEQEAAVPIEPGTENVEVDLQVTWSLE